MISIIVAVAENGVIGDKNSLLWHISEDLKHFKAITSGHPVVMGRKDLRIARTAAPGPHECRRHAAGDRNRGGAASSTRWRRLSRSSPPTRRSSSSAGGDLCPGTAAGRQILSHAGPPPLRRRYPLSGVEPRRVAAGRLRGAELRRPIPLPLHLRNLPAPINGTRSGLYEILCATPPP